jgi:hypothetical protein
MRELLAFTYATADGSRWGCRRRLTPQLSYRKKIFT